MALAKAIGVEIADSATTRTLRWVKDLSTQQLIEDLPRVWEDLFSFGDVEVRALGDARCRVDVSNAHPESPARDTMMAGLLGRLFTFTGATGVDVYVSSGLTRGASIFRVGWQPPSPKSWE